MRCVVVLLILLALGSCLARRRHHTTTTPTKVAFFDFDQTLSARHVYSVYGGKVPSTGVPSGDLVKNWGDASRQEEVKSFLAKLKTAGVQTVIVTHGNTPLVEKVLEQLGLPEGSYVKIYDMAGMVSLKGMQVNGKPLALGDICKGNRHVSKRLAILDFFGTAKDTFTGADCVFVDDDGSNTADVAQGFPDMHVINCAVSGMTTLDFQEVLHKFIPEEEEVEDKTVPTTLCATVAESFPEMTYEVNEPCKSKKQDQCNDKDDKCCWSRRFDCVSFDAEPYEAPVAPVMVPMYQYCRDVAGLKVVVYNSEACKDETESTCKGTGAVGSCCYSRSANMGMGACSEITELADDE
jgi:hydroxymethylpyrimidine pyrophosphatase-like HAD family hydrolase